MEAGMVENRRDTAGHVHKIIRKKRRIRRKNMVRTAPMELQRLYMSCRDVFKGPGTVPSSLDVQKLCHMLDRMIPEHVGLSRDLQFFKPEGPVEGTPRVTYTTIYSKLLLGKMHIKAYDWADSANSDAEPSQPRLARLKANRVFTAPCDTSVLYPTSGGNIHSFTAITPCVVLDVLGPPYSKEDGRDCSYYRDTPYTASSNGERSVPEEEGDSYGWLEEVEMPKDSEMEGIEYLGPQIIDI